MAREQRRLAAIVSADVAGYSRLMGRDESGTLAALKALRREVVDPPIAAHGGRIVKTTGDGLLLEFPSVVDAVRCVIEVQTAMAGRRAGTPDDKRIAFRIGVNLGDIIIDGDDIFGDGVNIAARLQEIAPAGGVCVSSRVHDDVRDRLDIAFEDGGTKTLKNIVRPVQVWRWAPSAGAEPPAIETSLALLDKPSIAVLPFQNMSGDPEQEYFTDGITEDVITELSRFHELAVIARTTSFAYKDRSVDVRIIGAELGVRYVVEGSIRKASNRVRVTGQLIDVATGAHVWADRYDRALEDVFAVQEELTQSIVRAITPHIREAEIAKVQRRRPENLGAYEIAVRAHARSWEAYVKSQPGLCDLAIADARAALAIDPNSTIALDALAFSQYQHVLFHTVPDVAAAWQDGLAAATRSTEIDRTGCFGHMIKGVLIAFTIALEGAEDRFDEALLCVRRAHELNPNHTLAAIALAYVETVVGNSARAIELMQNALERGPRDPLRPTMYQQLVLACLLERRYDEAVRYGLLGIDEAPGFAPTHSQLALSYVGLGDIEKARASYQEAVRLAPAMMEKLMNRGMVRQDKTQEHLLVFRRVAAGLVDPSAADAVR